MSVCFTAFAASFDANTIANTITNTMICVSTNKIGEHSVSTISTLISAATELRHLHDELGKSSPSPSQTQENYGKLWPADPHRQRIGLRSF
jgi:hypothetical protein